MNSKVPLLLVALIVVFALAAGMRVYYLARPHASTDAFLLSHHGYGWAFYPWFFAVAVLDVYVVQGIARRWYSAVAVGLISIAVSAGSAAAMLALAASDLEATRGAYAENRMERGFPVREEALEFVFSAPYLLSATAALLLFHLLIVFLLLRARKHLHGTQA